MGSKFKSFIKLGTANSSNSIKTEPEKKAVPVEKNFDKTVIISKDKPPQAYHTTDVQIGTYLQEERVRANLSIKQVSQATKIHPNYIEAIEREDFKNTPPFIYVKAYVKKMCSLYKIDEEYAQNLLSKHEAEKEPLPEKVLETLESTKQVDKEQEKKIQSYFRLAMVVACLVVVLIIILVVAIATRGEKIIDKPLSSEQRIAMKSNIQKLVAPQVIEMNELKAPSQNQ